MKQEMSVLGIDIAKRVFHAIEMDNTGKIVSRPSGSTIPRSAGRVQPPGGSAAPPAPLRRWAPEGYAFTGGREGGGTQ